ncbi:MAG TPA: T9SS type A sorting domain-containing protein, partial [Saprospiraceae bacterium]|nr:T9SS type A sorting domain-containing protein [Saprospiraceae bacterium]
NRSTYVLDSTRFGYFADFDIGCHADDFIGCIPQQNTFYAYNADNIDGDPGCFPNTPGYQYNPPVQAVTFLNRKLNGYIYHLNSIAGNPPAAMTDPILKAEYYSYLKSRWKDGLPYTYGGNGYDPTGNSPETSYIFPGDPNDDMEWSMVSGNFDPSMLDIRTLALNNIGTFYPGDAVRFDIAYSWHRGSSLSNLENVTLMQQRLPVLIDLYNQHFAGSCAAVSTANDPDDFPAFDIFPNPSDGIVHLQFPQQQMGELTVYDISGKLVLFNTKEVFDELEVDLRRLPAGIYFLHATFGQQVVREKIVLTN